MSEKTDREKAPERERVADSEKRYPDNAPEKPQRIHTYDASQKNLIIDGERYPAELLFKLGLRPLAVNEALHVVESGHPGTLTIKIVPK